MRHPRHREKAERNLSFYNTHVRGFREYKDWMILVLFHILLHHVDEYLSRVHGVHEMRASGRKYVPPHSVRTRHIADRLPYDFHKSFRDLMDRSFEARYRDGVEKKMRWSKAKEWEKWVLAVSKDLLKKTS